MYKAVCVRTCTFNRRYYREGDVYEGAERPPEHFLIAEEDKVESETPQPKRSRPKK